MIRSRGGDEVDRACSPHGSGENVYKIFFEKPERKRPLGRPRLGWENSIKVDLMKIYLEDVDWINLVQYVGRSRAVVSRAVNLRFRYKT
jgi:hypothetical protein